MPASPPRSAARSSAAALASMASPTPISTRPQPPPSGTTTSPARGLSARVPSLGDALVGEALDLLHILAFDANEAGRALAPRRMQVAFIVEIGHAGCEPVLPDGARLARLSFAGARHRLVIGHHRLAARLAVDRPRRAVVVRVAVLGAVVDMAKDAEAELRVFVQHLAVRHVIVEMCPDEGIVLQHLQNQAADLLAPLDTRIVFEDPVAFRRELLEAVTHLMISSVSLVHNRGY